MHDINCNSLKNPNVELSDKLADACSRKKPIDIVRRMFLRSFPSLSKKIKLKALPVQVTSFFMNVFVNTIENKKTRFIANSNATYEKR